MAARKLRERIAEAAGLTITGEPQLEVPAIDKTESLAEQAKKGFDAINALYAERNASAELAADLNQQLQHVRAINIGQREETVFWRQRCEYLMQVVARQEAHLSQAGDLFRRINDEMRRANAVIEKMPHPLPLSNNPDLPRVNSIGVPVVTMHRIEADEPEPLQQFDDTGLPYNTANDGPPPVDAAELSRLVNRINGVDRQS